MYEYRVVWGKSKSSSFLFFLICINKPIKARRAKIKTNITAPMLMNDDVLYSHVLEREGIFEASAQLLRSLQNLF